MTTDLPTIRLHPDDDVAVALKVLAPDRPAAEGLVAGERVPKGHKVALCALAPGAPVRKFGQVIGSATWAIAPGDGVHEHNLAMGEDLARDHAFGAERRPGGPCRRRSAPPSRTSAAPAVGPEPATTSPSRPR